MKMQDGFGFELHALFETIHNWATGQIHNEDSPPEVEVIEPGALGNANGPSGASGDTVLRTRLEAGSVSITDTVEDGQYRRQRTRSMRFATIEMTIEVETLNVPISSISNRKVFIMASDKQIAANRRNAQKSTGPRSQEGRATSSQNALRHGLTAEQIIVSGETKEEFTAFYWDLYLALNPADAVAEVLVERIIAGEWRLRRMYRAEIGLADAVGGAENVFHGMHNQMAALSRYETALDRGVQRARHELERHQARLRGETVAPPIAVTVSGTLDVEDQPRPSRNRAHQANDDRQSSISATPRTDDIPRVENDPVDGGSPMPDPP